MLLLVIAACIAAPSSAAAATVAGHYDLRQMGGDGATAVTSCRGWGGDADAHGHLYAACPFFGPTGVMQPALAEFDAAGRTVALGWLPAGYAFNDRYAVRDVGVAPDGNTAYVSVGPNTDNLGAHPELNPDTKQPLADGARQGEVVKLVRQSSGTWAFDPTWHAGPFLLDGNYWAVKYVDVDAAGHVYVSVNEFIYELNPATGALLSSFGGAQTLSPGGPWVDGFDMPEGFTVTGDGLTMLIVDQRHQIVQKWHRTRVGGDWLRDRSFLLGVPDAVGDYCDTTDHFQSPYDVGVDSAGDIYVLDTTCQRIQRFTAAGTFVETIWSNAGGDWLVHGLAVSPDGSVLVPLVEEFIQRRDPLPLAADGGGTGGGGNQQPVRVRSKVAIAGRGCSRVSPLRRVATPARYVIVDRCASLRGVVTAVRGSARSRTVTVRLTRAATNAIYDNATTQLTIVAVGDAATRLRGTIARGRVVSLTGTIIATRTRTTAYLAPLDAAAG